MRALISHPVDLVFTFIGNRKKMFSLGWGDEKLLARPLNEWFAKKPFSVEPKQKIRNKNGNQSEIYLSFHSPLKSFLPKPSHLAHALYLKKKGNKSACVILAGSREEGFALRKTIYKPLLQQGIDVVILENPFCGLRRPDYQKDFSVKTVSDHVLLIVGMVEEARSLLAWLNKQNYEKLVVAGYSMGGFMSTLTASLMPFPLGLSTMAAGLSPYIPFTELLLSYTIDFKKLAPEGGSAQDAKKRLGDLFKQGCLNRFPMPEWSKYSIVLGCHLDGFIPKEETKKLSQFLKGSELRWIWAGHISALFTEREALRKSIRDVVAKMPVMN